MMTWKMLQTMMTVLPLLLLPLMSDQAWGQGNEFNLTTIEPDDETIDSLINAVDTAVTSLQNAAGGTTDSSFPGFENYPDYSSREVSSTRASHKLTY